MASPNPDSFGANQNEDSGGPERQVDGPPSWRGSHRGGRGRGGGRFNNRFPRGRRGGGGFGRPGGGFRRDGSPEEQPESDYLPREGRFQDPTAHKLQQIAGPTVDLPSLETEEKKFSGRNRLYIGNLSCDVTEEDFQELFGKCDGEYAELFINKEKSFAFIKFDYYATCEKVKREFDGYMLKGKNLKIRFAPNNAAIKVKNLPSYVSNELLNYAFGVFGEIERCLVCVDERGRPTGEGVVEYARKGFAMNAIRRCSERCFFITESLRPVVVEAYECTNDSDGLPEKFLPKRNPEYLKARSKGPRLSEPDSFEHEYGLRWKQLLQLYAQKEEGLKKELQMEMEKLEAQMEYAKYEHETEMLRETLRAREQDRDRQKAEWEMRERQVEEMRRRNDEQMRRQDSLQTDFRRRQQETELFMQAHQLHNLINEQEEQGFQKPPLMNEHSPFDGSDHSGGPQPSNSFRRDRWITERNDDFAPKRRRF